MKRTKRSWKAKGVWATTLTRYGSGRHFRTDEEFNEVYIGNDTRYSTLSVDGGWGPLHDLLANIAKGVPLGARVRVTIEVG